MTLHQSIARSSRGPLKALPIKEFIPEDCYYGSCLQDYEKGSPRSPTNLDSVTPFRRLGTTSRLTSILPPPLRASSYRAHRSITSSAEDIRHHFPIKATTNKVKQHVDLGDSPTKYHTHSDLSSRLNSVSELSCVNQKRPRLDVRDHPFGDTNQVKNSEILPPLKPHLKPTLIMMGAGIRTHPNYSRRHSESDSGIVSGRIGINDQRLSPICPIPMPSAFPSQFPVTYASVSLPWEPITSSLASSATRRTVETQTSPAVTDPLTPGSVGQQPPRLNRRISGTGQMLTGLRKTLGNLRRAISADHIQRTSRYSQEPTQMRSPLTKDFQKSKTSENGARLIRSSVKRIAGLTRSSPIIVADGKFKRSDNSKLLTDLSSVDSSDMSNLLHTSEITCTVIGKLADGSIRIALRRPSTLHQFGFFIARDSLGIYISRLGGVRIAAKLWDVFHVGDRIIEVQGLPCSRLEVQDVQNLIRGCELVEFRVKSARGNRIKQCQSE
ncbi:unnamed protein product [Calicophoron daubneyi]|uniref:PDZ domain-containing protein n=1 Tax=Calicophoron daubneyi TaxID=300641 RepID=A0AAV2TNW4_CALDB